MAHLEVAMEEMKKELQESQKAQSMAKEELLMVKYKNSLLERILLENSEYTKLRSGQEALLT